MGKPSHTNPMRQTVSPLRVLRWPAAALLALACASAGRPQTQATTLPLLFPRAIVFDPQGNLYFAETANHVIRKVTPAGVLTTIAGTGVQGFAGDNGPATAAQLDSPAGLALDAAGNLYLADTHNHRIRRIAVATGLISTIAGTGAPGFSGDGSPAISAQLDLPTALALDAAANLYFADTGNHRIRKIAAGLISTVAGNGVQALAGDNGPATAASIDSPSGLALDSAGNLYLADTHNGRIRVVSAATGLIATVAGTATPSGGLPIFTGDGGPATAATLALPRGLILDAAGNLYLADSANHRIRRISAAGTIATVAGQGTETFAGDNAPAVAASLDSPRSVALSPAGLVTLADTGNQRIRQIDALPAPGPDIHTIAGLGVTTAGILSLTGPSVVAYGGGTLTATLTTGALATGAITFLDTSGGAVATLATAPLNADSATLSTGALAAGAHSITATYPGDPTHSPAQSSALALAVTPLALTAVPNPAAILYGQPVPTLGGTLSGVLPQDAGRVAAVFTTTAAVLSPVGLYPIAAMLTGLSAADYTVAAAPASLTVAQAPTLTTLSASTTATSLGLPVTLDLQAASTTSGAPTGSITLLDGAAPLSIQPLSAASSAVYTTTTLALGSHALSAVYSGDTNFLPSTSAVATVAVGAASDFTLTPTNSTAQSVPSGSSATFTFSVQTQGAPLSSPIALAVVGAPLGATASINPSYLPPGGAVTTFTLSVLTPKAEILRPPRPFAPQSPIPAPLFAVLLFPAIAFARRSRPKCQIGTRAPRRSPVVIAVTAASCILPLVFATGCGNRVNTAPESIDATTYTLTVTATATSPAGAALQHSVNVTLQVLQ